MKIYKCRRALALVLAFMLTVAVGGSAFSADVSSNEESTVVTQFYYIIHDENGNIIDEGITLTGAGALLGGLDKLIQLETGMATVVAENPLECTVAGLGRCLENEAVRKLPAMYAQTK